MGDAIQMLIDDKRDLISRIGLFPQGKSGDLVKMQSPKPPDSGCSAGGSDSIGPCRDTLGKSSIDSPTPTHH